MPKEDSSMWYESKELLDADQIHNSDQIFDGYFELNLDNFFTARRLDGANILTKKKFKPIHHSKPFEGSQPQVFDDDSFRVEQESHTFVKDQLAVAIVKLAQKSAALDKQLTVLEAKMDSIARNLLECEKNSRNSRDNDSASASKWLSGTRVLWLAWPAVVLLVVSRYWRPASVKWA